MNTSNMKYAGRVAFGAAVLSLVLCVPMTANAALTLTCPSGTPLAVVTCSKSCLNQPGDATSCLENCASSASSQQRSTVMKNIKACTTIKI